MIISLIPVTLCMLIRGDILRRNYLKMLVTLSGQRVKHWNHVRTVQARDIQHVYTLPHVVTPWKPRDSCLSNRSYTANMLGTLLFRQGQCTIIRQPLGREIKEMLTLLEGAGESELKLGYKLDTFGCRKKEECWKHHWFIN